MTTRHKAPKYRKTRKRRPSYVDPVLEEERAKRVAKIQAKRQTTIDKVKLSLERRRNNKIAIQNARTDKREREEQKAIRDAHKTGSEKIMLQVLSILLYYYYLDYYLDESLHYSVKLYFIKIYITFNAVL